MKNPRNLLGLSSIPLPPFRIGRTASTLRVECGLTMSAISRSLGMSERTWLRLEQGKTKPRSIDAMGLAFLLLRKHYGDDRVRAWLDAAIDRRNP